MKDMRCGRKIRKSFSRIDEITEMPNLIEVQKKSYKWFLEEGLRQVFQDVGAITDYTGNLELTFYDYTLEETPKYSVTECKARDATYAAPLKVRMRLRNKETEEIKEQEQNGNKFIEIVNDTIKVEKNIVLKFFNIVDDKGNLIKKLNNP